MGRRKTAKHAQRGTGFDPEVLSLCRPTRVGGLSDCERNWKVGGSAALSSRSALLLINGLDQVAASKATGW